MEEKTIKEKMKNLWKKTFQDSNEYISLIFDNYFDLKYVAYKEENGNIVSALLGIPYVFKKGNNSLKGLYLCGLATSPENRGKGIMEELIEEINQRSLSLGFTFTFLIPASDSLLNYYSRRGYEKGMYRIEDRYTNVHDFANDYHTSLEKENKQISELKMSRFESLECKYLNNDDSDAYEKILTFIQDQEEQTNQYLTLLHNKKNLSIVLEENSIGNGRIAYVANEKNEVSGVAIFDYDEHKRIQIKRLYSKEHSDYFKLLDFISKTNPESSLSVFRYPEETDRKGLIMKVYGAANPDGGMLDGQYGMAERVYKVNAHAKPYGMIRINDVDEILKFQTKDRKDLKYSILVKSDSRAISGVKYEVANGELKKEEMDSLSFEKESRRSDSTVLTRRELLSILFRKKESTNVIMEAFGIPRISTNMALLLD